MKQCEVGLHAQGFVGTVRGELQHASPPRIRSDGISGPSYRTTTATFQQHPETQTNAYLLHGDNGLGRSGLGLSLRSHFVVLGGVGGKELVNSRRVKRARLKLDNRCRSENRGGAVNKGGSAATEGGQR